jgi:hypothetical protein
MKLTALWAMAVLAAANLSAKDLSAKDARAFAHTVQICAGDTIDFRTFSLAQAVTAKVFAGIGIKIGWAEGRCPAGAIRVDLLNETPTLLLPGALAYALPYEGTHVVVFFDRITSIAGPGFIPILLGHVIAHEVTHILEGVVRHSSEGVMKAHWTPDDYQQMTWKPLPFAQEDVDLIYRGLEKREEDKREEITSR